MIQQFHSWAYTQKNWKQKLKYLYTPVHSALFTVAKRWKQSKHPSEDEWINKMWSTHTMEYYSALKRKESLTCATTGMNLEDVMPTDGSQTQKDSTVWFHLWEVLRIVKFTERGRRMGVVRVWGRQNEELVYKGDTVLGWEDEKSSGGGWWWWLPNSVNVLTTP